MAEDPLLWLDKLNVFPKVYWQSREKDLILAAAGAAKKKDVIPEIEPDEKIRYFGGISFDEETWKGFPYCYFFAPKYEQEFESIPEGSFWQAEKPISRHDSLDRKSWEAQVEEFLKEDQLEKIVFGRRSTLVFKKKVSPLALLSALRAQAKNATLFAFQLAPELAFIGATPEKLYKRVGNQISCDVLAGTAAKGSVSEEQFLNDPKERREFDLVKTYVVSALKELCETVTEGEVCIRSTNTLHHLYCSLSGILKEGVTDADILAKLHPTPAICGLPKEIAQNHLKKENFIRGWYAAPFGWISDTGAEFCVGIRSALIEENKVHLFSAAGIVEGSIASKEWDELEHKITPFLKLW